MYVARVPNRNSPPAYLLREGWREGGKVKTRTLANLSHWPLTKIEALRRVLADAAPSAAGGGVKMLRSLPHGHVAAVLGTARRIGLDRLLASGEGGSRQARLALALAVARVVEPSSKLATARQLDAATASSSLGALLALDAVAEKELYATLDWLLERQPRIEKALAKRHLKDSTLVLYDLTSTWFEGHTCPLAKHGHNRDRKSGKLQIVFGLLCAANGCPVAVEVFEGNTGDPTTLKPQVDKLKERFGLSRVVLVGDRGMVTTRQIETVLKPAGLEWITALRNASIRALADAGSVQLSLFDERDMAEIASPDYPGERLIVCRNPLLADERARKRRELLDATERNLAKITAATQRVRRPLRGKDKIGLAIGKVLDRHKMAKHFEIDITDTGFTAVRKLSDIAEETALDGFYVIRTPVPAEALSTADTVAAYKSLASVERAFRSIKTVDLEVRPIHHRLADRVRAHIFLCMLAYHLEWHMRQALAPILFDDHDRAAAAARRRSIVAPATRSEAAHRKIALKQTDDGLPVHSFRTLLADLATFTRNTMAIEGETAETFILYPQLTAVQQTAFALLGVSPKK
jgi:transposase